MSSGCAYETLACAARAIAEQYSECTAASDCVIEFWQGGCMPVCQEPINKVHIDEYRAAMGTEVHAYCACATNPPSVTCGPANPPLDCVAGRCARARLVDAGIPDASPEPQDAAAEPPDAAVEPPDAAVESPDTAVELPDAMRDAGTPDGCTPETDSQLCAALGLTCGPGKGIDNCGSIRAVDCGGCGTLPICEPLTAGPCERICSRDGFCWAYPRPLGNSLKGISGTAADDVWIAGSFGTILHWDGAALRRVPSGTTTTFSAVKAFSSSEAWVTGEGQPPATLRWNGSNWEPIPGDVGGASLWGSSPTDVWVDRGNHWDGQGWTRSSYGIPWFGAMWGTGPNDVWSYEGMNVYHFDGTAWTSTPTNDSRPFMFNGGGIAGTSATDVWAGGYQRLVHWDGSAWSEQASPSTQSLVALTSSGAEVFAQFRSETYRRSTSGWDLVHTLPSDALARRIWTDGTEFWFASPSLLHWDGVSFNSFQTPWSAMTAGQVWGVPDDLWAVSTDRPVVSQWSGREWSHFDLSAHASLFRDIAGSGPSDVWVVGDQSAVLHWNGSIWARVPVPAAGELRKVYATAANDAWISGDSAFLRWDGAAWKIAAAPAPGALLSMWAASPIDVWASCEGHGIRHFDGSTWDPVNLPSPAGTQFTKLWGTRSDDVWAFGSTANQDVVVHWDGAAWSSIPQPSTGWVVKLACGAGAGMLAVSLPVTNVVGLYSWNGSAFERRPSEPVFNDTPVRGCVSDSDGNVSLVLLDGSVLQRSGRWR